jgi:hypothetical protein
MQYTQEHHETLYGFRERDKFDYSIDIVFEEFEEIKMRLH